MKRLKDIIIILLLAVVLPASAASAKEASVLLQEGLYAEEVEGDLDAAIKIYRQVIAGSEGMKQAAAQATYRIAMCYLKKGRKPEAAKEFRNLLSEFPQQESLVREAQKQLAKLEPPMPGSFGPVMERTVYDDGAGKDFTLDLDTGKCFSVSDASSKSLESFILERGIDVVGETKESVQGLMGIDMVVIPIANERWEISPGDVLEAVSLGKPGRPVVLSGKGTLPATFIFKTIAGNMGVLQILEVQANQAPRYIRIRYKMLQQKAEREVFIPDADTKDVGVVLDLASGELLKAGTGQEQLTIFRKLGKGDLAYDGVLICLRGAKAKLIVSDMRGDHLTDLTIKGQMEDLTAYELELRTIPGRFSVTTAEGDNYDLIIHSADSTGLTLSYDKDSNENQITALITKFFGAVSQNRNDDAIQMLLYEKPRAERVVMGFQNSPNIGKVRADEIYFTKNLALVVTTEISGPDGGKGRFAIRLVRKNNTWLIEEFDTDIDEEIEAFKKEYVTTQTKIQYRKMPVQGLKSWQQKQYQIFDNTVLDLDSGFLISVSKDITREYDVGWDNDGGGVLMVNPKKSAHIISLSGVEKGKHEEAIEAAEKSLELLQQSPAKGFLAAQTVFCAVLTDKGNLAIIEIAEYSREKGKLNVWMKEKAKSPIDLSTPEATIKSFVKAVYDGNLEAAGECVSKDGSDYDEFKEMLATESNHPFQAMIKAMDVSVPVEITNKDVTDGKCKIKWYLTLGRVYYFGENKMKKGTHQEFGSYLEFVGGKWLIRDI